MNSALPEDTEEVREQTVTFESHELRKDLYKVAAEKRLDDEKKLAIKLILLGWNWRAYAGTSITNAELDKQLSEFIDRMSPLTGHLETADQTLESVDFEADIEGNTIEDRIKGGYRYLLDQPGIDSTGASKAFHMLHPEVFMMWDNAIEERYHQQGEEMHWAENAHSGKHQRGRADCYVTFLTETQRFVRQSLDMGEFSKKSPAKIMDEYNYAKYTLPSEQE